jgi:osmotically-inducible protein OsmY
MPKESLIARDVADELRAEPAIHAEGISVSASDGIIVLAGNVDSYRERIWRSMQRRCARRPSSRPRG